jgi:ABC-2 type transport system permease protein
VSNLQLYLRYLGISLRGQMQYRASFVMQAIGLLMMTGVEFMAIVFLFQRFGSLEGWRLPEIALLYGIVNIAFSLAEGVGRGFDVFQNMVKTGDFDRLLVRPRSTILQVAGQELQLMRLGRTIQAMAVLGYALVSLNLAASPARLLLLGAVIVGGACLFYGLFVLQATLAFWTIESLEIMNTVTYGGTETGQYPLSIYRPWFRHFFTFVVPLACINYLPAGMLMGDSDRFSIPEAVQWAAPLIGVAFMLISFQAWKLGVRHYRSTGS